MNNTTSSKIYTTCEITKTITLPISAVGKKIHTTLENSIIASVELKCILEGFVKKGSVKLINYSSGIVKGDKIIYDVIFTCDVFYSVTGMQLKCKIIENTTAAGIRAESADESPSPFIVYIIKDHYYNDEYFNSLVSGDIIMATAKMQRFEINDEFVAVIADLVPPSSITS